MVMFAHGSSPVHASDEELSDRLLEVSRTTQWGGNTLVEEYGRRAALKLERRLYWLTFWLVILTIVVAVATVVLVWLEVTPP